MKARPEFTVIAGPNGAGKSRLCSYYIHCKSFDGDLLALDLRKEHPEWEEHWISGTVAGELQKQKDDAIALHKDFAFETNFSNDLRGCVKIGTPLFFMHKGLTFPSSAFVLS